MQSDDIKNKNTVVLFGAGAEIDLGLCTGAEFAKNVVGDNTHAMNAAIKKFYKGIEKRDDWYPAYYGIKWKQDDLICASQKKKWMTEGVQIKSKKKFEEQVQAAIRKLDRMAQDELQNDYPSYMGILDERFHTIISPRALGPYKFWSVINCYWRAYLSLVCSILPDQKIEWIMNHPKEVYNKMSLCASAHIEEDTYYKVLREHNKSNNIRIITTNYTPLCSQIAKISDDDIAYLHGSFKWFERPKEMKIVDVTDPLADLSVNDYFPFIFLQSGIKPIIGSVQLNEWSKALSYLKDAERLLIVGYKANGDDNHINSIIRDFLVKNRTVLYFDFDGQEEADILKRFYLNENPGGFERIHITKKNALQEFANRL